MRAIALTLLVAACATVSSTASPPERVAGCWINRDGAATTMRWSASRERPGVLDGTRIIYGQPGATASTRYGLELRDAAWTLCEITGDERCWQVAQGEGGSLEGGRVFVDRHGDRLRITVAGDGPEQIIFQGRRDGCD